MAQKVFVSYCHQDKDAVNTFLSLISKKSFDVWMDYHSLKTGDYYISEIFKEIAASDIYLVFLSKASQESKWLKEEMEYALKETINNGHLKIAGIILDDSAIPEALSHRHLIDGKTSVFNAATTFTKDFQGESINSGVETTITSVSFGISDETDVEIQNNPFYEGNSVKDLEEATEQLLNDLRNQLQGIVLNLIDVKDFNLHSNTPQFRNGVFSERLRKVGGSTNGTTCQMVTVEATIFHPMASKVHKFLTDSIDKFDCIYITFGLTNSCMVGNKKTMFEIHSLERMQNAYTIIGYDAEEGVKIEYTEDVFISVSYPEDGVKIKVSTKSKWDFRKFIKEFDVFQFVEWLMSE